MGVLAIIAALVLEQWRPLDDRKAVAGALAGWADWLENTFNAGESRHGAIAWLVAALAPLALTGMLYAALFWLNPFAALLLNIAALYLTLGFRQFSHYFTGIQSAVRESDVDRARELLGAWRGESATHRSREEVVRLAIEEAIAASHRHVFAVLFWFVLLPGPSGAILYRMAVFLDRRWGGKGEFGRFARKVLFVLEWPAVRLTAAAFAVVGDFEDAIYCWRTQAAVWPDPHLGIVLAAGAGALGVKLGMPLTEVEGLQPRPELGLGEAADAPFLDSTVGLLWRALVLWVFVLIILTVARIF
ncbi:MAG: CobD/CbiB family protein [Betaproteobacteria bacterium]|nr:CobD/CbiB family protein [Betaproteobacteria bacterium]